MDSTVLLCFVLMFSCQMLAYRIDNEKIPKYSIYDDDYYDYDDEERRENDDMNKNITTPKPATYEVTEDVDDLPNPSTKFGPTITNYTTPRPLNNASLTNIQITTVKTDTNSETNDSKEDIKSKKNSYSILHVKAEYDDKPTAPLYWDEGHVHHKLGIKDYIYGISKGIYNKITRLFNKHDCDGKHDFESNEFRSENTKTANGFVKELHDDTYLLGDYE